MSKRRLHDGFMWENRKFARLSMFQRLLFCALIDTVDDQGRMFAEPCYVRARTFPYDDLSVEDMQAHLIALADNQSIFLYETDGQACLQILNWWKYQSPQWASPSKLPPPEGWQDRIRHRLANQILTYNWGDRLGKALSDTCDATGLPLGTPLVNALPKALPKALAKSETKGQGYDYGYDHDYDHSYGYDHGALDAPNNNHDPPGHDEFAQKLLEIGFYGEMPDELASLCCQEFWQLRHIDDWWHWIQHHQKQKTHVQQLFFLADRIRSNVKLPIADRVDNSWLDDAIEVTRARYEVEDGNTE